MSNTMGNANLREGLTVITVCPVSFAKRFREARAAAGLTQRQLADACNISDRTVSAWETGVAEGIIAEHLFCVADKLGVNARWLATGELDPGSATPEVAELLRGIESLPPDQQAVVKALIQSLRR